MKDQFQPIPTNISMSMNPGANMMTPQQPQPAMIQDSLQFLHNNLMNLIYPEGSPMQTMTHNEEKYMIKATQNLNVI